MIKAITFDLWDTIIVDNSDEKIRDISKEEERLVILSHILANYEPVVREKLVQVIDDVTTEFNYEWKENCVTWTVLDRVQRILDILQIEISKIDLMTIVDKFESIELDYELDFAPNIKESLDDLSKDYQLGVISDTIFTPGKNLRKILSKKRILDHFDFCLFSDEFGLSKPSKAIFEEATRLFSINKNEVAHIGDREYNDIRGAKEAGMKSILSRVIKHTENDTVADLVVSDYRDLSDLIKQFNK